ncbi:hypothetical protein SNEBB_000035 [Seison nebaliae]|nr:hypothetical protein SNEBB_000035 [Seison nebaliae]
MDLYFSFLIIVVLLTGGRTTSNTTTNQTEIVSECKRLNELFHDKLRPLENKYNFRIKRKFRCNNETTEERLNFYEKQNKVLQKIIKKCDDTPMTEIKENIDCWKNLKYNYTRRSIFYTLVVKISWRLHQQIEEICSLESLKSEIVEEWTNVKKDCSKNFKRITNLLVVHAERCPVNELENFKNFELPTGFCENFNGNSSVDQCPTNSFYNLRKCLIGSSDVRKKEIGKPFSSQENFNKRIKKTNKLYNGIEDDLPMENEEEDIALSFSWFYQNQIPLLVGIAMGILVVLVVILSLCLIEKVRKNWGSWSQQDNNLRYHILPN